MPKTQRSPTAGQQCSSESDISNTTHQNTAREHVGKRQKRQLQVSPPAGPESITGASLILSEFRHEFSECMAEMRELRNEMAQLRESFTAVSARLDCVEKRLDQLEQRPVEGDASATAALERTIHQLKLELSERDQEALLSDLEIGQLPEEKGENITHTVTVLAARLGVTLEERDVVFAERVGAPPRGETGADGRARRVVVRLVRRRLRDDLLRAARVRRTLTNPAGGRVYVNERLTRSNRQLFHRVREECRTHQWRYSWTNRGRIFVRRADGAPAFQLRTVDDLTRVLALGAS